MMRAPSPAAGMGARRRALGIDGKLAIVIALLLGVFSLAILGAAGLVATQRLDVTETAMARTLRQGLAVNHTDALRRSGDYLSNRLFNPLYNLDVSSLNDEIAQVSLWLPVIDFLVLDRDGRILTDGSQANPDYGRPVPLAAALKVGQPMVREDVQGSELAFVIGYGDAVAGYARIRLDNTGLERSVAALEADSRRFRDAYADNLVALGSLALLAVLAIGGILSWRLSFSLTRPLLEMRDAAQAYARGDLGRRLPVRGDDELSQLAGDLNRMACDLSRSHQMLAAAQSISGIGSWEWEPASGRMHWSDQTYRLFGVDPHQFRPGLDALLALVDPADRDTLALLLGQDAGAHLCEVTRTAADGSQRTLVFQAEPLRRAGAGERGLIGTVQDVTEARKTESRLSYLANFDALTGLPNRYLFHDRLDHAMAHSDRCGDALAVMFLDLDRFKAVNDALGHAAGDRLLKLTAERLAGIVRRSDTVARLGGDEFTILMEDCGTDRDVAALADKVIEALNRPMVLDGRTVHISASIGITMYPSDADDVDSLLKNADIAMYHAKAAGRATLRFFTRELNSQAQQRLLVENRLHHALDQGEFHLAYQPQVDVASGRLVGTEALLRWTSDGEAVAPTDFIPVLEETGRIVPVGRWVLEQACRQTRHWQDAGLTDLRVAVNFSARQFRQPDLYDQIADVLDRTGLPAHCLEVEITESTLMDIEASARVLARLSALGVRIAIDDFGTGYSSLTYLQRFAVHGLKVDRSFVADISHDRDDAAIVAAIVGLARNLGVDVTAEGVETEAQFGFLRSCGCTLAQGWLFGRPMAAAAFQDWLESTGRGPAGAAPAQAGPAWEPGYGMPPGAQPAPAGLAG